MARKIKNSKNITRKNFTKNIHSTVRANTDFSGMSNWDEKKAKAENKVCCKNCRFWLLGCSEYLGAYHKPCKEFEWD